MENKYIVDLKNIQLSDLELVGGKNASLGEMIQNLGKLGVSIPGGFALTVDAYWEFIKHNKLESTIQKLINSIEKDISYAMTNSFGFGGHNAVLIFSRN